MAISCFKKENLHYTWDDSIVGMYCMCADYLSSLYEKLEDESQAPYKVTPTDDSSYPFVDENGTAWRFVYVVHSATDDTGGDPVKQAFMSGKKVIRRYRNGAWEVMYDTSYFDLPGYEYIVAEDDAPAPERVSNKALAEWLAKGKGFLIDVETRRIGTSYNFPADEMYCEVPAGCKVMPMGSDDWLEPTEDVICGDPAKQAFMDNLKVLRKYDTGVRGAIRDTEE